MCKAGLVLVHGLYATGASPVAATMAAARVQRCTAFATHGQALGVTGYEWVSGRGRALANRILRFARGTAPAVDAVEIIEFEEAAIYRSLAEDSTRSLWRQFVSCAPYGFDVARSFVLIGAQLSLLDGPAVGQRVLWFGRGLTQLSDAQFVAHYANHHGPLVARHARELGLRRYRQVPGEADGLCKQLRELGLGRGDAPPVFAELYVGSPPMNLASLRARRNAAREIKQDEKRHIDFGRSMLLLASK